MDIFDGSERIVKCVKKYDTSPYSCDYELLEIAGKYTPFTKMIFQSGHAARIVMQKCI